MFGDLYDVARRLDEARRIYGPSLLRYRREYELPALEQDALDAAREMSDDAEMQAMDDPEDEALWERWREAYRRAVELQHALRDLRGWIRQMEKS